MANAPLIFYATLLMLGVLGMVGLLLHRLTSSRRKTPHGEFPTENRQARRETTRTTGPTLGLGLTPSEPMKLSATQVLVATKHPRQRKCPTCSKSFHESLVICPNDQTPLVVQDELVQKKRVVEARELPTCPECARRYDSGANFCRADGKKLVVGAEHALSVWVCLHCGDESAHVLKKCCASPEVVKVDPSSTEYVTPLLPLMSCPMCHGVTSHSASLVCAIDATPLIPMLNLKRTCIAPLGVGPRRRICERCGRQHSKSAKYCAHDGSVLKEMN